jgi:hypothetical protein
MAFVVKQQTLAAAQEITSVYPDPSYVTFVAKTQKAKTRKGLHYFILRITIPKEVAQKADVKPDDYLLLKAKKAQWYHMMDWNEMESAWKILPQEIKTKVVMADLPNPDSLRSLGAPTTPQSYWSQFGSTAGAATSSKPMMITAADGHSGGGER